MVGAEVFDVNGMKGRTVLVTGSTDGIGKRTAHDLAAMGATVLLHGRNASKGAAAAEEIARSTGTDPLLAVRGPPDGRRASGR
jgi:NAD(P)-dependent dehydrogenase (short-subunit alcohol dehydrogenase family)